MCLQSTCGLALNRVGLPDGGTDHPSVPAVDEGSVFPTMPRHRSNRGTAAGRAVIGGIVELKIWGWVAKKIKPPSMRPPVSGTRRRAQPLGPDSPSQAVTVSRESTERTKRRKLAVMWDSAGER